MRQANKCNFISEYPRLLSLPNLEASSFSICEGPETATSAYSGTMIRVTLNGLSSANQSIGAMFHGAIEKPTNYLRPSGKSNKKLRSRSVSCYARSCRVKCPSAPQMRCALLCLTSLANELGSKGMKTCFYGIHPQIACQMLRIARKP